MQNFGGTAKGIMVFLKTAICIKNNFLPKLKYAAALLL